MSGGLSPHLRELSKTLAPEYGPETPSEAVSRLLEYYQRLDGPRLVELDAFQKLAESDPKSASDLLDGVKTNRIAFLDAIDRSEAALRGGRQILNSPFACLARRSDFRAQVHEAGAYRPGDICVNKDL